MKTFLAVCYILFLYPSRFVPVVTSSLSLSFRLPSTPFSLRLLSGKTVASTEPLVSSVFEPESTTILCTVSKPVNFLRLSTQNLTQHPRSAAFADASPIDHNNACISPRTPNPTPGPGASPSLHPNPPLDNLHDDIPALEAYSVVARVVPVLRSRTSSAQSTYSLLLARPLRNYAVSAARKTTARTSQGPRSSRPCQRSPNRRGHWQRCLAHVPQKARCRG
ncbi:hypothetical protein DFH07DRAFT_836201 [Mycena maculata]|uniref:Secreted protein n=1 Tax=Mycena maculata TaxID=230809 RepID=A0AAD7IGY2_9AGAR|nr:hypothetical protein DFH07DRAFT_836201 [Mycena maculata]